MSASPDSAVLHVPSLVDRRASRTPVIAGGIRRLPKPASEPVRSVALRNERLPISIGHDPQQENKPNDWFPQEVADLIRSGTEANAVAEDSRNWQFCSESNCVTLVRQFT